MKKLIVIFAACILSLTSLGYAQDLSLEGKTIGVAVLGTDHFWDRVAFNSAIDTIEALGGTAIGVDGERDDQKHIANHENLLAQGVDVIVSILGATDVMDPTFQKISEAEDTMLFTVDQSTTWTVNNSTSDNYYIGSSIGRLMAESLGGEGKVAVFHGFGGLRICETRYDMWKYVLQDYPDIELLEPELQDESPNTIESARQKTADLLQKYPKGDIDHIHVACWDQPAMGVVQALEEAGRTEIGVTGIDGSPEALEIMLEEGSPFIGNIAQQPALIAQTSIENIAKYFAGITIPKTSYVEPIAVDKLNVEVINEQLYGDSE